MRAKGFRLLQWNRNVRMDVQDRNLLDPVKSRDPAYIRHCIEEKMRGTSVTVVLIGSRTHTSEWVDYEIRRSIEDGKGLLGIRLKGAETAPLPARLADSGAKVMQWAPDSFEPEIERAARAADVGRRSAASLAEDGSTLSQRGGFAGGGASCARPHT